MIAIVDDESAVIDVIGDLLTDDGHTVDGYTSAKEALIAFENKEPEIVFSDVMMPEMSGFEFQEAYFQKFPYRATPFIFLSCLDDPETIIRGLEQGATDFLSKSINPAVLKAKVRSHLQIRKRYSRQSFRGNLATFPLHRIMQFCEHHGLTGTLEITHPEFTATIPFKGGRITDHTFLAIIEQLLDQPQGSFVLNSQPVLFDDLARTRDVESVEDVVQEEDTGEKLMGKLSGLKVNNRCFQIQTELIPKPERHLLTVVVLDGQVVMQRKTVLTKKYSIGELERQVEYHHKSVEEELRTKLAQRVAEKQEQKEVEPTDYHALVERGHECFMRKDYSMAMSCWEKALILRPDAAVLKVNLAVAKRKQEESM